MKQYIDLLKAIEAQGTDKPAARANMPGSRSLFGYQFRHNLADGFPLLTTKKMYWKGIVAELLWFLRGDTNIKFLVDNGINIWNGDAYNYYLKKCNEVKVANQVPVGIETFISRVKTGETPMSHNLAISGYQYGDCGYQYGKVWTNWLGEPFLAGNTSGGDNHIYIDQPSINQITRVIRSLRETPESRRHIVTAVDPAHDTDLALYWCHSMFQFNCRPLSHKERLDLFFAEDNKYNHPHYDDETVDNIEGISLGQDSDRFFSNLMDEPENRVPKYYLDCQLYQRSADSILGVPFNIASYALLTHFIAKIVNMVPGEFIHSFGDAHVYDNHKEAMEEQLSRTPTELPKLKINSLPFDYLEAGEDWDNFLYGLKIEDFTLEGYNPQPAIKAELSTG